MFFVSRHVFVQVRKQPQLWIKARLVPKEAASPLKRRTALVEEGVDRRIEASAERLPAGIRTNTSWLPCGAGIARRIDRISGRSADAHRCTAGVEVDARNAPVADDPGRRSVRHILAPFAERQIVDGGELEIVRHVVFADRFLQAAIEEIRRIARCPRLNRNQSEASRTRTTIAKPDRPNSASGTLRSAHDKSSGRCGRPGRHRYQSRCTAEKAAAPARPFR